MKRRTGRALILTALLALPAIAEGTTRFVIHARFSVPEDPAGEYDSPLTPANTIQKALDVSVPGDTVLVAGVAFEDFLSSGGSYNEGISIPKGIVLLGGWDQAEAIGGGDQRAIQYDSLWTYILPPPDTRGCRFEYDSTIARIDTLTIDTVTTLDTVWAWSGPDSGTVLRGFMIRSAVTNLSDGAGAFVRFGSPRIDHNLFVNNQTNAARGAGIFVGNGSPRISHNTFAFCRTSPGSGVVHIAGGSPRVIDNIFYNTGLGTAIACTDSSALSPISYNLFYLNGGRDTLGCPADTTNTFERDPVFCDVVQDDYRMFVESEFAAGASDGGGFGAWGIGCRAGVKYVSAELPGDVFPYDTPENAARTIGAALSAARPGDTVLVASAEYTENLILPAGVQLIGGYSINFAGGQVDVILPGTIVRPADPDVPIVSIASGDTTGMAFVVLTGASGPEGGVVEIDGGAARFEHISVIGNEAADSTSALLHVSGGGTASFRYSLFAENRNSIVLGCDGSGSIRADSCDFFGNDSIADGACAVSLTQTFDVVPLFCDLENGDYRLYSETSIFSAAPGGLPIGALSTGCNFVFHYVAQDAGAGIFPYETPEHATGDLAAVLDIADVADTIRVAGGTYEVNLTVDKAILIQGGWTDTTFSERDIDPGRTVLAGVVEGEPTVRLTSPSQSQSPRNGIIGCVITHADGVKGGGILVDGSARPLIEHNLVIGNTIDRSTGGDASAAGIDMRGTNGGFVIPTVRFNTIVANVVENAPEGDHSGSGVYVENASGGGKRIELSSNIIAYNTGGSGGYVDNTRSKDIFLNVGWGNIDRADTEENFLSFDRRQVDKFNIEADPDFCDTTAGVYNLSNCSPAAADTFSASGDTVAGAFSISPDCQCEYSSFLVNASSQTGSYPFSSLRTASGSVNALSPYLNAGDTVKVATGNVLFETIELVNGVKYLGGYDPGSFSNETRGDEGRSRMGGLKEFRLVHGGQGISDSTLLDGFEFTGGVADTGAVAYLEGNASPVFANSLFLRNRADSTGVIIYAADEAAPIMFDCIIYDNKHVRKEGALIHLAGGGGTFHDNTISNNQGDGRGFLIENCAPEIYNNVITFNDAGIRSVGGEGTIFDHNNVFHNGIDMEIDFTEGEGNISLEARYCNRFARNYRLFDHSPHLRAGRDGSTIGAREVGCSTPRHFVSADGSDEYPYSTPGTAARSIQDAIDVASFAGFNDPDSIDEVRVLGGVYEEDIKLPTNVRLRGGFREGFSTDDRDPEANVTELIGSGEGPVVVIDSAVVGRTPVRGTEEATILDGFDITGGDSDRGGGIRIGSGGSPVVRRNMIHDNRAVFGGGIFAESGATPVVSTNQIVRNSAETGSGIYVDTVAAPTTAIYENNTFFANEAGSDTGGVFHTDGALVWFQENVVTYSVRGKAYSTRNEEPANINHNLFYGNPGGDSLDPAETSVSTSDLFQIVSNPEYCDTAAGDLSVLYDRQAIRDSVSVLQDSCATRWWGAKGAGCTREGHRFLVRQSGSNDKPIYPYVCKENAANMIGDAAARVSAGDTIEVATNRFQNGVRLTHKVNMRFTKPVVIRGGWDLDFSFAAPDPDSTNLFTVVEPLLEGPIVVIEQDSAATEKNDPIIDSNTVIEGLIFQNGNSHLENGGAIQVKGGASPTIRKNQFLDNRTENWGGAISIEGAKSPRIYENYFDGNRAGLGGAIYLFRTEDPVIRGNVISRNDATTYGGIRMEEITGGSVDNNIFYRNGGGGLSLSEPTDTVVIANNSITSNGGYGLSLFPAFDGINLPLLEANDVWDNGGGNYLNLEPGDGDLSVPPQYCSVEPENDVNSAGLWAAGADFFRYQECSPLLASGRDVASDLDAVIGIARSSEPVCPDTTVPGLTIGFLLHSTMGGVANLFVVPDEALRRDSISLTLTYGDRVDTTTGPADSTQIPPSDSVAFRTVSLPLRKIGGNPVTYTTDNVVIESSDSLILTSRAVDLCGLVGYGERIFSAERFKTGIGGALRSTDGRFVLDVPSGAFRKSGVVLMEMLPEGKRAKGDSEDPAVTGACRVNTEQIDPSRSLLLSVDVSRLGPSRAELNHLSIYSLIDGDWVLVESRVDPALERVNAEIPGSGTYQVRSSEGVVSRDLVPARLVLYPNMPNPFNPVTKIIFDLPARRAVDLEVFDVSGRLVRTIHRGDLPAGRHAFDWNGTDDRERPVGSGVYFYRLKAGDRSQTRKMILIR